MKKYAIALYDNEAESDDELNFKKGDLLIVIEFDYLQMVGWCLCELIKTNQIGLAAGNRIKLINDSRVLSRINKIIEVRSSSNSLNSSNNSQIDSLVFALSSPSTSISTSTYSLSSSLSNDLYEQDELDLSNENESKVSSQEETSDTSTRAQSLQLPPKTSFPLIPAKIKKGESCNTLLSNKSYSNQQSSSTDNDDDYDYDVPENEIPLNILNIKKVSSTIGSSLEAIQKQTNPLLEKNVSSPSVSSLPNSDIQNSSNKLDNLNTKQPDDKEEDLKIKYQNSVIDIKSQIQNLKLNYKDRVEKSSYLSCKEALNRLRESLLEFLGSSAKQIKQEHACFHPNLNIFNDFKNIYRKLKEFYLVFNDLYEKFNKYKWNFELIQLELVDILKKSSYLNELIQQFSNLIDKNDIFNHHQQTLALDLVAHKYTDNYDEYQYDYENCTYENVNNSTTSSDDIYENDSDYWLAENNHNQPITNPPNKIVKNELIKREIRRTEDHQEDSRSKMNDQMVLKFYLRHIEENFDDLKKTHELLLTALDGLDKNNQYDELKCINDLCKGLTLNGHKLIFICDTLQRNINNKLLKQSLFESSSSLYESIKLFVIRMKKLEPILISKNEPNNSEFYNFKQNKLINDSINEIYNMAYNLKQVILKYYFKSY